MLRSKVAEELSDVRTKIAELSERKIAAEDQLRHDRHSRAADGLGASS